MFKAPKKDIYIVFGDAMMQDDRSELERAAAQLRQVEQSALASGAAGENDDAPDLLEVEGETKAPAASGEEEGGVEAKDIELVMQQVTCTRQQAVAALKKHNGDIVNAIMELQF